MFRAPELRPKICGAPTLQDKNIGAPGLHDISFGDPGFTVIKYSRAPGIEIIGAPGSKANISGLQGSRDPPSGHCYLSAKTGCSPGKHISPDISLQSGYFAERFRWVLLISTRTSHFSSASFARTCMFLSFTVLYCDSVSERM